MLPARELLADLLFELNQPAATLVEYRAVLSTDPNRFRSLLGEARAAKQTGDFAAAHDAYRKLLALIKPLGPGRPELAEAKVLSNRLKPKCGRKTRSWWDGKLSQVFGWDDVIQQPIGAARDDANTWPVAKSIAIGSRQQRLPPCPLIDCVNS